MGNLLAAREAIGVARSETGSESPCIHGKRGVQVRVAEMGARGEVSVRMGRMGPIAQSFTNFHSGRGAREAVSRVVV